MPRKATKAYKNEVWEVFYGINPKTFEVESVSKSRGGVLTRWGKEGVHTHPILTGRQARNEVVLVYGLTDIFVVNPHFENQESTRKRIEELKAKAAEMKRAAEARRPRD